MDFANKIDSDDLFAPFWALALMTFWKGYDLGMIELGINSLFAVFLLPKPKNAYTLFIYTFLNLSDF